MNNRKIKPVMQWALECRKNEFDQEWFTPSAIVEALQWHGVFIDLKNIYGYLDRWEALGIIERQDHFKSYSSNYDFKIVDRDTPLATCKEGAVREAVVTYDENGNPSVDWVIVACAVPITYSYKEKIDYSPPADGQVKSSEYRLIEHYRPARFSVKHRIKAANGKPYAIYDHVIRRNVLFRSIESEAKEQAENLNQQLAVNTLQQWFDGDVFDPKQIIHRWVPDV